MFMKWQEILARSSEVQQQAGRLWRSTLGPFLARSVGRAGHYSRLVTQFCSLLLAGQPVVPLIVKLAAKNLFHDRLRFIATLIGIVFSIVLVSVQMGLFLSFGRMVTTMIDHAPADLWIIPRGTKCFEDPSLLDERERFRAMAVKGVSDAIPILISFAQWRVPNGGTVPVLVIGANLWAAGLRPWNIFEGTLDSLSIPDAVAIDRSYFERLGSKGLGDTAEIRDQRAQVRLVTTGIRSFTTTPYVFTPLDRARAYTATPPNKTTYLLVQLAPDADVEEVRDRLTSTLAKAEVLTPAEFRKRSRSFWLFETGAGAALFAGALLGMIVGSVIVAQTLYSNTKEHLNEFATLRAIGTSRMYIQIVIIVQALLSAVIGFAIALGTGLLVVKVTAATALPVVMTPTLMASLFLLTVAMCVTSAISAIIQVVRIDPATAFTR
jgi:putative ABC transport system permease protein